MHLSTVYVRFLLELLSPRSLAINVLMAVFECSCYVNPKVYKESCDQTHFFTLYPHMVDNHFYVSLDEVRVSICSILNKMSKNSNFSLHQEPCSFVTP